MMGRTHIAIGVTSGLAASQAAGLGPAPTAAVCASAWVGSLMPDVDEPGSRIRRYPLSRVLLWPFTPVLDKLGHRGVTHGVFAGLAVAAITAWLLVFLDWRVALLAGGGLAVGYLLHIAADACTLSGVPVLAPLSNRRVWLLPRFLRFPTGGFREGVVMVVVLAAAVCVAVV